MGITSFFSFSSSSSSKSGSTSKRTETVITPDGRRVTKSMESVGDQISAKIEEANPDGTIHRKVGAMDGSKGSDKKGEGSEQCVVDDSGNCQSSGADGANVGSDSCSSDFQEGYEPKDDAVDHVKGSACCNPEPEM